MLPIYFYFKKSSASIFACVMTNLPLLLEGMADSQKLISY
jgi:hypothetical protein